MCLVSGLGVTIINRMLDAGFRKHPSLLLEPLTLAPLALSPSVPPASPAACGREQTHSGAGLVPISGAVLLGLL